LIHPQSIPPIYPRLKIHNPSMNKDSSSFSRRQFLQTSGALSVGALLFGPRLAAAEGDSAVPQKVAKRKFGRTGVEVSHVGLGCMFDTINAQVVLRSDR
jgi:hypothetical protein